MQKVEEAAQKGSDALNQGIVYENSPELRLIADCCALAMDIENEIVIVHYFACEKYSVKFPELESLVIHPIYYAQVVKQIGNEMDITSADLEELLPRNIADAVSSTASKTRGKPLSEENLNKTIAACDRLLSLDLAKKMILYYFESRMEFVAPNLSALVGSAVAANLIWTAGGLSMLAKLPFARLHRRPNVFIGVDTYFRADMPNVLPHFSMPSIQSTLCSLCPRSFEHTESTVCLLCPILFENIESAVRSLCPGLFDPTELFGSAPRSLKMLVCNLLACRSVEAAEIDSRRGDPTGQVGRIFWEDIHKKIVKWQERPPEEQQSKLCRQDFNCMVEWVESRCAESTSLWREPRSPKDTRASYVESFAADETMSALSVIFEFGPGHKWALMHPNVWHRWLARRNRNTFKRHS